MSLWLGDTWEERERGAPRHTTPSEQQRGGDISNRAPAISSLDICLCQVASGFALKRGSTTGLAMESLGTLTYRELQAFAKRRGVKANRSRVDLIQRLVRDIVGGAGLFACPICRVLYEVINKRSIRGLVPVACML